MRIIRRYSLKWVCLSVSMALFLLCLGEAVIRWDAMAGPVRIIIRLIGYGKLSFREVYDAVRPDIASLLYPIWVLIGALCALSGALASVFGRRGAFVSAACFLVGGATLLSPLGTALHGLRLARGYLLLALGCLFFLRILLRRRRNRPGEETRIKNGREDALFSNRERRRAPSGTRDARERERLFAPRERRRLFGAEKERPALFGEKKNGKGNGEDGHG